MPLALTPEQRAAALTRNQASPWVWLWELVADQTIVATTCFHITSYPEPITFDRGDGDPAFSYSPFPMRHGKISENREGDLLSLDLTLGNATKALTYRILEEGKGGFLNMPAILCLAHKDLLSHGPALRLDLTVGGITVGLESVTFSMESPNYFKVRAPRDLYVVEGCLAGFKDVDCAYRGLLADCNRTRARCVEIGDDEVANGRPRRHPLNYKAFPALLRRG